MPTFLVDVSSAASGTRHVNKERRHNLNTHVHAGTTPIIRLLSNFKKQGTFYYLKMVQ